ncbi:uncharacterized protein VP01_1321g5 [Puccinia sorghi]|uniref:Uncharacterized protein n=1 Tax=Puccinia sorghi TaxID=27349 RepID=A0A0L6VMN9_9BASI|nr:uncharacterized protein VP01_1321g5 [Puccinia sorghi]
MDDSTELTTFEDSSYQPTPKSPTKSLSSAMDAHPDAATVVSNVSPHSKVMEPMPTSLGVNHRRPGWNSNLAGEAAHPQESFSPPSVAASSNLTVSSSVAVPSTSAIPTPETLAMGSIETEAPPPQHNSPRAVAVALISVSTVIMIVLLVGYLTSQRFRRWRESRRARSTEAKWKISRPLRENHSPDASMREAPQVQISPNELLYDAPDPFARSMPRQSRMLFNLGLSDPVEEIDEERGWLWGTHTYKKTRNGPTVTPGLGIGRYRSKKGRTTSIIPSSRQSDTGFDQMDDIKEELMYVEEVGGASEYDDEQEEPSSQGGHPLSGVSYLLGRLKQSISSRSGLSSLGSSAGRSRTDTSRSQWNEVGRLVHYDEKDIALQDDGYDKKTVGFQATAPFISAPHLCPMTLPELPAVTWDDHSGMKVANTKRVRAASLEVEINGAGADYQPTSAALRHQDPCPRSFAAPSVRQLVSRLEGNLPGPSSRQQAERTRKEALSSRLVHPKPDQFTHLPTRNSSRTRTAGKIHGLVKAKSKHLYPGGYVGRSPTKKLRRKESPDS